MAEIDQFTAEYFDQQKAGLAKPLPSGEAARADKSGNFVTHVWDEITVQPFWNAVAQTADAFQKYDPTFEPLSKENLKGFEQYAGVLREARNAEHDAAIKARITRFTETKQSIDENGGLLSGFASELFNPINYLIPGSGMIRGAGALKGFARGVAAGAPGQLVDEAIRQQVDPTATLMESGSNLAYGLVFSGLLGSGVGMMKRIDVDGLSNAYKADIDRHTGVRTQFEQGMTTATKSAEFDVKIKDLEAQLEQAKNPKVRSSIRTEIDNLYKEQGIGVTVKAPEGPAVKSNISPAAKTADELANIEPGPSTGVYKLADQVKGILRINAFGDLITSGVGVWESFAHRVIGEHDLVLNRNVLDKLPTDASLYLGNGMNTGRAIEYRDNMTNIFGEYLGGGLEQFTVAGLNVPVTGRRMSDWARGIVGSRNSDGLMNYTEFKDMTYRSLRDDGTITVPEKRPDGTIVSDYEKKIIEKAAGETAALYRDLGERFIKTGYLRTKESAIKQLDIFKSAMTEHQDRLTDLYSVTKPSPKQLAEIEIREEALKVIGDKVTEMNTFGVKDEDFYQEKIKELVGSRIAKAEKSKDKLVELRQDFADRRTAMQSELQDLLDLDPEKVTSAHLRRMTYLEQKLDKGISEKQADFVTSLEAAVDKKYSKKQIEYLYYMFEKTDQLAQIRKDIEDGTVSFERLRQNYVPIIYDIDKILADEAGDQILRKKIKEKFTQDSTEGNFYREKKELAYEKGLQKASRLIEKAESLSDIYKEIKRLEKEARGLRAALAPDDLKKIIEEQNRIKKVVDQRVANVEAKITKEEIAAYKKQESNIDITSLETRLAVLYGMQDIRKINSDKLSAEINWMINKRVDGAMNSILRQGELGELSVGVSNGASFMAKRKLGFAAHEIADFTITDLDALSISYSHRGGMASQLTGAFGSRDAVVGMYRALADGVNSLENNNVETLMGQINKAKNSMIDVRDYALGDHWVKDVTAWDRKAVRAIMDWSTTTNLSNSVVSSLADVTRSLTTFGVQKNMEFAFKGMFSDMAAMKAMTAELKSLTGEFGEVAGAASAHTFVNGGGVTSAGTNWMTRSMDKFSGFANGPFFIANGLTILTEVLKRWTGLMSAHFLIEDAVKIANKTADERTLANWRAASLADDDAFKIAKLLKDNVIERPNYGYYANTGKWNDDELVNRFAVAVRSEIRRTIVTAGPANKPTAAQGFIGQGEDRKEIAMARIPFHLMSWAFAANNKIMLSALQGRDANMFGSVLTLIGMGGMVSYLTTPDNFWEKLTMEEKILRSVEKSGVFGIFTDIPAMVETASRGHYGIRPMLGMDPPYGEVDGYRQFSRVAGAPTSNFVNLYKTFVDQDLTDRQRAKAVVNMVPLTGAFYWKEGWQQLGRSAADAMN
jgi:hypothetical protein